MNFRVRAQVLVWLLLCARLLSAQSTNIRPETRPSTGPGSGQSRQREQWFFHGRMLPGHSAAALRYRAQRQKLQLRAFRAAPHAAGPAATPRVAAGTVWTPLGPAPLASDATGLGVQDYGPVSGRATAVAVDPADGSGNTVYIGAAYGGVWKSSNAGSAQPESFKCYLDSAYRRSAHSGRGLNRHPTPVDQPRCAPECGAGRHGRD